jgi:drug/metabolite transporter (DMT)-like permease
MNWFILAILAGVASNFFNIFNRSSLKERGDSTVYAWWFEVIRFFIFLGLFLLNPLFPKEPIAYLWLFLFGLTEVGSVYFFMRSHQLTDLSISTFIIKLQLIWIPILAFILIGERLSVSDYTGISVILFGIFIAVYSKGMKKDKGVLITFISSLLISLLSVLMKITTEYATTPLILICMSLPSIIILPLLMKQAQKRIKGISRKNLTKNMLGAISNVISMYLAVSAVRHGSTSKVTAVFQGMMIISLAYSIIVLKEKKQVWQKIVGASITILGLVILTR